jgi:hypothetical protein
VAGEANRVAAAFRFNQNNQTMAKKPTSTKKDGRGGRREGAGRKPLLPDIAPLADRIEAAEYARNYTRQCIDGLLSIATNSKSDQSRIAAYDKILCRGLGAVAQGIELSTRDNDPLKIDAGFKEFAAALNAIAAKKVDQA